jgi:acetylornithine deacetylase/succinyl-diaminopimelate desuccinylase-like protein
MMDISVDDVISGIDRDELVRFTLEICNVDSSVGHERSVAERLHDWLEREGFSVRRIGLLADRYNLLARLPESTRGRPSLMFNGHMDTFSPLHADLVQLEPMRDELHKAWVEGDLLVGDGVVNDKGPIAAFMIAAKAIKDSGWPLKGELLLSAVVAETAYEPADGPPGEIVDAKELGARFLATHGGVADYVIVAEGTGFGIVWIESGKFWFKVTLRSRHPCFYTPYMPERTTPADSPNMIVAATSAIQAIEGWAEKYERRSVLRSAGARFIRKCKSARFAAASRHGRFYRRNCAICISTSAPCPVQIRWICGTRSTPHCRRPALITRSSFTSSGPVMRRRGSSR